MDGKDDFLHILLQRLTTSSEAVDVETDPVHFCSNLVESLARNQAALVGEIVATLCSEETFREQARENGVLSALLPFLSSTDSHTQLQVLRAIGNLCIDNDNNRETVLAAGGCQTLIQLIKKCSNDECINERYKSVVCGCVLNLVVDNERLAQEFLHHGALEEITSLLSASNQPETVVKYGLEVLCLLVEAANQVSIKFLKTSLNLLKGDFVDLVLNFIKTLVEKDEDISLQLVEVGICKQLLQIENQQQAMDILVLLLGKDKCVKVIMDAGEVLNVARSWLEGTESSTQSQKANAALIIANMARSDSNCTSLVKSGIVPLLIALVKLEETEPMKGKLHHAALSALRNLSLPNDHKEVFFSMGVVDCAIYALKASTLSHEQFKAIGILRLLVEKQAHTCSYVILEAMECLNRVCEESGIPHVHIETGRLLSAVVKYCQDNNVLAKIFKEGGLKWIYNLIKCEQPQLIAEGLIAINILAVIMREETFANFVEEASSSIADCLCSVLTSSFPLNLINNSLLLIKTLLSTKSGLTDVLKGSMEVKQVVQKLTSHENDEIQLLAKEILELL